MLLATDSILSSPSPAHDVSDLPETPSTPFDQYKVIHPDGADKNESVFSHIICKPKPEALV